MPELAEVEFYRKKWGPGLGQPIKSVKLHGEKRLFRGADPKAIVEKLQGARLTGSEARGKQMLFRFSGGGWLGIHLGMTGELRCEPPGYEPQKHDHLVLEQRAQTLIFEDARMFGRVKFSAGRDAPDWWTSLPPALTSEEFTLKFLRDILHRRRRAPLKGVLLTQDAFPGVGNWMADEILWQAKLHPRTLAGALTPAASRRLWQKTQEVCRVAMESIGGAVGETWGEPPKGWLIHVRWKRTGPCPKKHGQLERAVVAGRTTVWCARCQPEI